MAKAILALNRPGKDLIGYARAIRGTDRVVLCLFEAERCETVALLKDARILLRRPRKAKSPTRKPKAAQSATPHAKNGNLAPDAEPVKPITP